MSLLKAPRSWLFGAVFATAFWITIRVLAASTPAPAAPAPAPVDVEAQPWGESRDPALEKMISDFANAARH
jgi:hypothetical protein